MALLEALRGCVAAWDGEAGENKKNYTERLSAGITDVVTARLCELGLTGTKAPKGRDKQFMGGYGTKGVDAYLSDEKHGLLLSSGTKGILFDVRKNLKNRYRDMVMEALELHKRFPYAVCGHLFFVGAVDSAQANRAFGTTLGEVNALLSTICGRRRPDEAAEVYECLGVMLVQPGRPETVDLEPAGLPEHLWASTYCERMVAAFRLRNPFYGD